MITRQEGLGIDAVHSVCEDAQGRIWFAGGSTTPYRLDHGKVSAAISSEQSRDLKSVWAVLAARDEAMWMVTNLGILRVSRRELNEFAVGARRSVSFAAYGRGDGLATTEVGGIQPACLKARDGTLWFGTIKGAAFLDPKALGSNSLPPPVLIEEVRIDDEPVKESGSQADGGASEAEDEPRSGVRPSSPITLLPHQRRLEFRFTGLSLTAPARVQFRYQMEGFDPDWVDGGTARTVSYT